ncbi:hypothetical protein [Streptomyces albidochromogenes]|uniref:hypothetical protein n=1 Tax=Streptomyces albidochromogenes TaxID=329524 RepID=UPI001FCA6C2C|nr:hypothetical protein [Streptomyces albidochromogenes]
MGEPRVRAHPHGVAPVEAHLGSGLYDQGFGHFVERERGDPRFDLVLVDDGASEELLRDLDEHKVPYEVCPTAAGGADHD